MRFVNANEMFLLLMMRSATNQSHISKTIERMIQPAKIHFVMSCAMNVCCATVVVYDLRRSNPTAVYMSSPKMANDLNVENHTNMCAMRHPNEFVWKSLISIKSNLWSAFSSLFHEFPLQHPMIVGVSLYCQKEWWQYVCKRVRVSEFEREWFRGWCVDSFVDWFADWWLVADFHKFGRN